MTEWLLDTFFATSGLMLLVLLLRQPVRRLFGSRVTYALWLIPAARLFMPTLTHTVERTIPAHPAFVPTAMPLASESLWMARVAPPLEHSVMERIGGLPTLLLALWLAVAFGLFLSRMIAFHRDRRALLASGKPIARLGAVRIVRTPEVVSPVALGILRPLIALPSDFRQLYGPRERRLVLEHELAHHRSGDLAANLFAFVLLCLQWFNPLAWVAHAAFRFDQEAACDARVLDKGGSGDRADYGRAIAKAASGRALLFASALDRRNTLQRRLQSMLRTSNPARRLAGRLLVVTGIAAALPLTASRAVHDVDVRAAPVIASESAAPAAPRVLVATEASARPVARPSVLAAAAAVPAPAPRPVAVGVHLSPAAVAAQAGYDRSDDLTIDNGFVTIDGKTGRWEDLTPAEKDRVRSAVANARTALSTTRLDRARIMRDLASIPDKGRMAELQRDLAGSHANIEQSVRRMEAEEARARASGRDPDQLEQVIRATLQSVQTVDLRAASRALATVDRDKIAADVAGAQASMEAAKAELATLQARIDADRQR
jgi:bla regulator protein BlaR1